MLVSSWFSGCTDPADNPVPAPPADDPVARAVDWLAAHVDRATEGDPRGYDVLRAVTDPRGLTHVHFQQRVEGVPVFGGQVIVHLRADGGIRAVTDDLVAVRGLDLAPELGAEEARSLAEEGDVAPPEPDADLGLAPLPEPELWILRRPEAAPRLVWSVQSSVESPAPARPRVFVDAHDGREVWRYDELHTVQITNNTRYDGAKAIDVYQSGATKVLEDPGRDFVTASFQNTGSSLFYVTTNAPTFSDTTAAQLHWGTARVLDYWSAVHARDGIDGAGGPGFAPRAQTGVPALTGAAHYGVRVNNAFWDPTNEFFAAGDGFVLFSPLVSLDVVAHELTHGVNHYESGLVYADESGALDESAADVFGAAIEAWSDGATSASTWRIAEDCYTPTVANDALRYLDDPTADGSSIDHYDERYLGPLDNGGVHWNSGIGNLAFHLAAEGGAHPRLGGDPIAGVGLADAADIWYLALTAYVTASSGYHGMRIATLLAAEDLFGADAPEVHEIDAAWALVGVTPWVLQGSGWSADGVGAPAVAYRRPTGDVILAYESRTAPPSLTCPHGEWSIGLATSPDGRTFTPVGAGPVLSPTGAGWRACVVAHPSIVVDESGSGLHLWFKAEQDTTGGCDTEACLYSGVGYAHVTGALTATDTVSSGPVVGTSTVLGYPSVVSVGGAWQMLLQSAQEVRLATAPAAAGPWTLDPAPVLSPGVTGWSADEVYSPAATCEGDTALPAYPWRAWFGGRRLDVDGLVADGGIGDASSDDAADWLVNTSSLYAFEGNERWRHWSVADHGGEPIFYYSETVGGANRIGVRTRLTSWSADGMAPRTCPYPSWW